MPANRYNSSLTVFNPEGHLLQLDYALIAVQNGLPSVGLRATDAVILAIERKPDDDKKAEKISDHIGCVYSGMGADAAVLIRVGRVKAVQHKMKYGEEIPPKKLANEIAQYMLQFAKRGGVRPFGASLLIGGWDVALERPVLYQLFASGTYREYNSMAIGKHDERSKTFLQNRHNLDFRRDDCIHMALLTLRESFETGMSAESVEVAVIDSGGFRRLDAETITQNLKEL